MIFFQLRAGGDGDESDAALFAGLVKEAFDVLADGGGALVDECIFGFLDGVRQVVLRIGEGGEAYMI